ncbi:M15 family metallopeptidase [Enterovirga rhinocerotis]|uniref:D-alanyl-D-alanine dipeptidase n=1 Tax=Enterovirga rhinocerotis TaxID=1339210 RepID=A0A4V3DYR0_9HYPH|nr:M15 family metallopeptidase [Enterovirga rhinocerotis]TDR93629.1 D-Ala-D-Ala dipeptidase VanX [Enterovirga rhinocerotis]
MTARALPRRERSRRGPAALAVSLLIAALPAPTIAADPAVPPGFVRLSDVAPAIRQDIRYAGRSNFTGRPVPGYGAPECWLRREAALALALVARDLAASGWRLVVYDCYRPQRATAAFVAWARDPADQATKAEYYPRIDKARLFALGYIASASSHSRGIAVDAGAETAGGSPVDFGTAFDHFDPRSGAGHPDVGALAQANRRRLAAAFAARGFAGYAREWWHFGFRTGASAAHDRPITGR